MRSQGSLWTKWDIRYDSRTPLTVEIVLTDDPQFESLDNAIFKLNDQRVELSKAVSAVPLPEPKQAK